MLSGCADAAGDADALAAVADAVESSGGKIIQASTDHDAGQQLHGIGGAIAILRWKLD